MPILLSEMLRRARVDSPDEWRMDEFVKLAEALESKLLSALPTNTSSPKLPTLEEVVDHVGRFNRQHFCMNGLEQSAIEKAYNFIAGKIGRLSDVGVNF